MAKGMRSKVKRSNRSRLREEVIKPKLEKMQNKASLALQNVAGVSTVSLSSLMGQLNPSATTTASSRSVPVVTVEDSSASPAGAYQPAGGGMSKSRNGKKRVARKMSRHNKAFP